MSSTVFVEGKNLTINFDLDNGGVISRTLEKGGEI